MGAWYLVVPRVTGLFMYKRAVPKVPHRLYLAPWHAVAWRG